MNNYNNKKDRFHRHEHKAFCPSVVLDGAVKRGGS